MSLPLSIRTLLGPALLLACVLLPVPVGAQSTDSDDQQPQSESQSDAQQDQSSADEATNDDQLPPQPSDTQSPGQPSQDQSQYDQGQEQYDDPGQSQYDRQQYNRQAQPQRQNQRQRQQQFDRQTDQLDQRARNRQSSQDRQFQDDRDARQRQWDDQSQQFDQPDRGAATDRAFEDGRFERRQLEQQTTVRSADDLGLRINERDNGLAVMDIDRSSVLIDSGLRPGDVLISVRNQPLRRSVDLVRWVRTLEPGARVPVQIVRDGRRETIYITGIDFSRWQSDRGRYDSSGGAYLGVVFDDRYPSMALVEVVRPNTAADRAGLRPGDTIRRINGRSVRGLQHATALISQMQPGDEVELEFTRRTTGQAVARLGSRPDARQATFYEGEDQPTFDGEAAYQDRVTEYSEEIRTYDEETPRRVRPLQDDDERFGDRLRERAPLRRGLIRPFRNQ